jgi:hypothetical protein
MISVEECSNACELIIDNKLHHHRMHESYMALVALVHIPDNKFDVVKHMLPTDFLDMVMLYRQDKRITLWHSVITVKHNNRIIGIGVNGPFLHENDQLQIYIKPVHRKKFIASTIIKLFREHNLLKNNCRYKHHIL